MDRSRNSANRKSFWWRSCFVPCRAVPSALALIVWSSWPHQVLAKPDEIMPKVASYEIDALCIPEDAKLVATAVVRFADPATVRGDVVFYLHDGLEVASVEVAGKAMPFHAETSDYSHNYTGKARRIVVSIDEAADLGSGMTVDYGGTFRPSNARAPSDYMRIDEDGVLLRAYGYSLWFPVFLGAGSDVYPVDFPRVTIITPEAYTPVVVGARVREDVRNGQRHSEWRATQVDLFAPQLTARKFDALTHEGVYIYQQRDEASKKAATSILAFVEHLHRLFASHYGEARGLAQIHVMQMPEYGDISSGNVIGMSDEAWRSFDKNAANQRLLAHEFSHPFVQVPTRQSDPLYAMMIEGFPSYFYLPILAEIDGEESYAGRMSIIEARYLQKRKTGKSPWDEDIPKEKPIYEITPEEVGLYKDVFVLNDRVLLFFDYLRNRSGQDKFLAFTRDLFGRSELTSESFEAVVRKHIDVPSEDLRLWLRTTEFPERFHRASP